MWIYVRKLKWQIMDDSNNFSTYWEREIETLSSNYKPWNLDNFGSEKQGMIKVRLNVFMQFMYIWAPETSCMCPLCWVITIFFSLNDVFSLQKLYTILRDYPLTWVFPMSNELNPHVCVNRKIQNKFLEDRVFFIFMHLGPRDTNYRISKQVV